MLNFRKLAGLAAAVFVASAAAVPASATVVNGGFEVLDNSILTIATDKNAAGRTQASLSGTGNNSWGVFPNLTGWTVTSGPGIEVQTTGTINGNGPINPYEGKYYIELDSDGPATGTGEVTNSGMKQSLALSAGQYLLQFAYSPRVNEPLGNPSNTNGIKVTIGDLDTIVQGPPPLVNTWELKSFYFNILDAGNYDLTFLAVGNDESLGGFLDAISVSQVPLPAAAWLMLAGLGGLGLMSRRRAA
jgi:hypothetical protein